ncbi:MAG: hypothetical protein A2166_02565 [Omnitrophica WOR_2 bacterium RBG_13_41_10]|nr:MAG: hypothetical protein A2166_02565 [Omnitrophica WOR_2 bacterium RBG_13_41_10]
MPKKEQIIRFSKKFIYWDIILIPFAASFSSAVVNILIGWLIALYLLKKILLRDYQLKNNAITIPFLFIIIVSLISFFNSVSLKSSIGGMGKLFIYGFLLHIVWEELNDKKHLKRIIMAIILGVYLSSLDGVYQLAFGKDFFRNEPYDYVIGLTRLKAAFPHTNIFAAYLALFLPVGIALTLYYLKGRRKILLGLVMALGVYCLIFTFSRGAIFGFAAALLFMAIIKRSKLVLLSLAIALIISPLLLPKNIYDWIKTTDSVWEVLLNKERINIYKTSLNMIRSHPVIGVGVNTYCLNYQKYKIKETSGFTGDAKYYAHNIFLHMSGEIGLLGLAMFTWLVFMFFKTWHSYFKSVNSDFLKICCLGIAAGIIAFLINGLTETNLYYPKVAVLFWYQMGLSLGLFKLNKEKPDAEK